MSTSPVFYVFSAFGFLGSLYYLFNILQFIHIFIRKSSLPKYKHGDHQSWALVTGATSGIGFGFAQELCKQGFNVVIHGRNPSKLESLATELREQFPDRSVRIAVADVLRDDTIAAVNAVRDVVQDLHLTVLVNNIGGIGQILAPQFKTLESHTEQEITDIIQLNDGFTTQLTRALLPVLAKNQPSLIVNIGSIVAGLAMPYASVYSASKAYLVSFSRNLSLEMKAEGQNIEVLAIIVGDTLTEGRHGVTKSYMIPDGRGMAAAALERVGCGRREVCGYFPHAVQKASFDVMPEVLLDLFVVGEAKRLKAGAEVEAERAN